MKKIISILVLAFVPIFSHALECPSDAEKITAMIKTAKYCSEAADIAQTCAWGSSMDVQFVSEATDVCHKSFYSKLKRAELKNYENLTAACFKKYEKQSGTMYRSMAAHCALKVTEAFEAIYSPSEE